MHNCTVRYRFEKLFLTVDTAQPNYANICTALELLTYLLTILKKETILSSMKPLQRGISACMTCTNTKVIRCVHGLLSKLMSIFPTEPASSNVASKHDELEVLYACVSKVRQYSMIGIWYLLHLLRNWCCKRKVKKYDKVFWIWWLFIKKLCFTNLSHLSSKWQIWWWFRTIF